MAQEIIVGCRYRHKTLGMIKVKVVANARGIRARWEGSELLITVPGRCPADMYEKFISNHEQEILAIKPRQFFIPGQIIDGNPVDFTIKIRQDAIRTANIIVNDTAPERGKAANFTIMMPNYLVEDGFDLPEHQKFVNRCLLVAAAKATGRYLVPRARSLAEQVGHKPIGWNVKHNKRSLGQCGSNGIITLGARLIFLPPHLRDFVILHELAHLSEMNHSSAFHEICNKYCGGHEAELNKALKAFKFPVF